MKIKHALFQAYKTFRVSLNTPDSHIHGSNLEAYIRQYVFPLHSYKLLEKTHDFIQNSRDYVYSSLNPDFKFLDIETNKEFYVEVKLRNWVNDDNKIVWTYPEQLQRYNTLNKHVPVFLCIAEGYSYNPTSISLIPLNKANYIGLFSDYVDKFSIDMNRSVRSNYLWSI